LQSLPTPAEAAYWRQEWRRTLMRAMVVRNTSELVSCKAARQRGLPAGVKLVVRQSSGWTADMLNASITNFRKDRGRSNMLSQCAGGQSEILAISCLHGWRH